MTAYTARAIADHDVYPTCTLWHIARQMGVHHFSAQKLVRYVAMLVAGHNFPPPLPALNQQRAKLITDVCPQSIWRRAAVQAWLDDLLPAAASDTLERQARAAAAADMDAAASNLRCIDGGKGA